MKKIVFASLKSLKSGVGSGVTVFVSMVLKKPESGSGIRDSDQMIVDPIYCKVSYFDKYRT